MTETLEWIEVEPIVPVRHGVRTYVNKIKFSVKDKNGNFSICSIAPNIIEELNWKDGISLALFRNGSLFMLKPSPNGKFILSKPSKGSRMYRIRSKAFCITVGAYTKNASVFDAWSDYGQLLFKPEFTNENKASK